MPPSSTPARALRAAASSHLISARTAGAASSCRRPLHHRFSPRHSSLSPSPLILHHYRSLNTTAHSQRSHPPRSHDRGPPSAEETQTDFHKLDVLANMPAPTTAIDATFDDGFSLNSGLHVSNAGVLLVAGDAFKWRPWIRDDQAAAAAADSGVEGGETKKKKADKLRDQRGMWECDQSAWGALEVVWPKPDLLIIGTGATVVPISPTTRKHINDLGIRLEVSDTRNAAAQFNLLATERGVQQVAAALIPIGWKEGR
ncbi:NADH dehydrogenase (ubiquinone) 1 alpha subcomplex assembly factor 3 [Lasiodiplodia hormozganensis]|uniref:NADH dehydrogenase (Ubiquinone) 1 alpha subcomplex assembly factor 3 n=1 Tax=Lasiodiplodia hormozganensis TaxID=869390 RepID=A0AA39YVZ5_9PEZI|nr:NADH dehydrogenase (ubiquinone) 1 alpha subcomplex assembly factor 3 [Lasiodiplodia hormozganensis]